MNEHRQRRHSAAGVPVDIVELAPPLRLNWSLEGGAGVPLVCSDRVFAIMQRGLRGMTLDGHKLWGKRGDFYGLCAGRQFLLTASERRDRYTNYAFDFTGVDLFVTVGAYVAVLLHDEQHFIGITYRKNGRDSVGLYALPSLAETWRRDAEEFSPTFNFEGGVAAADGRVFVGTGPGLGEGEGLLIALREDTGEVLWSLDLESLGGPVEGGKWAPMVAHGLVVINTRGGATAVDVATGRVAWQVPPRGARAIYGDKVYIRNHGNYFIVDIASGRILLEHDIGAAMKKICPLVFQQLATKINVSETHVFAGDAEGGLWAWERDTGEVVWHDHPEGADAFIGVLPVIAGGRLYVSSVGLSGPSYLYCYEEDHGAGADKQAAQAPEEVASKKTAKKATASKPKARKKACPGYR